MAKRNWRYFMFLMAAHHPKEKLDHTIRIGLGTKNIYLCSRCTGVALGIAAIFIAGFLGFTLPGALTFTLIGVLPVFAAVDWFTQSAHLRQSNTALRIGSGFLLGISEGLGFLLLFSGNWLGFLVVVGLAALYAICVYVIASKTKCLQSYMDELNQVRLE
jgi:uncharacterized membrane protein